MVLDLVVGIILVTGGLLGWARGAVRQVVQLCALAAAIIWSPPVGRAIARVIDSSDVGVPGPLVDVLSMVGASILLFAAVTLVGLLCVHLMRPNPPVRALSRLNRLSGCVLGVTKVALACALGLAVLAALPERTIRSWPTWAGTGTRGSACLYWARACDPLSWTPAVGELQVVLDRLRQATGGQTDEPLEAPPADSRPDTSYRSTEPHAQPVCAGHIHEQTDS